MNTPKPSEGIYRRLTVRMYGDERFMRLSPQLPSGQALWIYLLTGPHTMQIPGVFRIGRAALAEALEWESEAFEKALAEVIAEGLAEFDAKTRVWFIPNAIKHNVPPNPNVVKSWRAQWHLLPECAFRDRIYGHLLKALTAVSDLFGKAFEEACGKASGKLFEKALPKGMAKQEQEQEQEQEKEKRPLVSSAAPTVPNCRYDRIVEIYHDVLPELPRVKLLDDVRGRKPNIAAFWKWTLTSTKSDGTRRATSTEEALAFIQKYFERVRSNDFVMGRTTRSAAHENWRADLDYLLSDKGRVQVIEKTEASA